MVLIEALEDIHWIPYMDGIFKGFLFAVTKKPNVFQ